MIGELVAGIAAGAVALAALLWMPSPVEAVGEIRRRLRLRLLPLWSGAGVAVAVIIAAAAGAGQQAGAILVTIVALTLVAFLLLAGFVVIYPEARR